MVGYSSRWRPNGNYASVPDKVVGNCEPLGHSWRTNCAIHRPNVRCLRSSIMDALLLIIGSCSQLCAAVRTSRQFRCELWRPTQSGLRLARRAPTRPHELQGLQARCRWRRVPECNLQLGPASMPARSRLPSPSKEWILLRRKLVVGAQLTGKTHRGELADMRPETRAV